MRYSILTHDDLLRSILLLANTYISIDAYIEVYRVAPLDFSLSLSLSLRSLFLRIYIQIEREG